MEDSWWPNESIVVRKVLPYRKSHRLSASRPELAATASFQAANNSAAAAFTATNSVTSKNRNFSYTMIYRAFIAFKERLKRLSNSGSVEEYLPSSCTEGISVWNSVIS